jgi:phenylalanyl-tRNA synthetase beta chain
VETIEADRTLPLAGVFLFDLYQGDQLPADKKSLSFRLSFKSPEKTLTDEEVNGYCAAITAALAERLGAALRS